MQHGTLTPDGCCVAESFHLLEEALRSDRRVRTILTAASVTATVTSHVRHLAGIRVVPVPDAIFREISSTETTQGVIALVEPPAWTLDQLIRGNALVVILDGVQDPGNAGAIVRSAEAFGATGVVFLKGTASPFNPKTLRASAGSLFRVPFVSGMDDDLAIASLSKKRLEFYATAPRDGRSLLDTDFTHRTAIVIGSEAHGVGERLRAASQDLHIPTSGVESLNAAIAASIVLYEARRQRTEQR